MFLSIIELDNGRYILRNALTGIVVSRDGTARTFKSKKKAQKYIDRTSMSLNKAIQGLSKTHGIPKI